MTLRNREEHLIDFKMDKVELAQGILLVDKPRGQTAFSLVAILRKILKVKKIGHAGTLDPFATGVMVMLIGRNYTRCSNEFLGQDKEYVADLFFGASTDTYDCDGKVVEESTVVPTLSQVEEVIAFFQGEIDQIPPMFSAKKIGGKKLYELARKGKEIERKPVKVTVSTEIISYHYPLLTLKVACSKGTYIRSLAYDIGEKLGCKAHLTSLRRTRSGVFTISECMDGAMLVRDMDVEKLKLCILEKK